MKTKITKRQEQGSGTAAFTFVDMIVTIALIAFVGVMILPAMARTTASGPAAQCLNNLRQQGVAWAMFSSDNGGTLVESHPWALVGGVRLSGVANPKSWAPGNAGTNSSSSAYGDPSLYGPTKLFGLTNNPYYSYLKDYSLFHCPSDGRTIGGTPILRSYSMNNWMGGVALSPGHRLFTKQEHILRPTATWVILDEDEVTLDDAYFATIMDSRGFVNLPGRRHNNGYSLNYADGRAEIRKLRDPASITRNTVPGSAGMGSSVDYQFHTNITTYP